MYLILYHCVVEAKTPKASSRWGRQTLAFSIRNSGTQLPRPTTKRRERLRKRRRRAKRWVRNGAHVDYGERGALLIGTRSGPFIGGTALSTSRTVRLLVRARTPDAPRMPRARAPTRTPSQCPYSLIHNPTRARGDKRWRRGQHYGGSTRLGSGRPQQLLIAPMLVYNIRIFKF